MSDTAASATALNKKGGGPRTAGPDVGAPRTASPDAASGPRGADPSVIAPPADRTGAASGPRTSGPSGPPTPRRGRLGPILGLTSAAYFMVVLDSLVVITALPQMQRSLHVGLPTLQWTVNSYGIAFAAGIITAAALGDRLGRRRVFIAGLALFTLASAA
ncbi:MAG TPA: MFS transporter, partial [Streptosporangiaceae bacterium]